MTIERGIPIPARPKVPRTGRAPLFPWGAMQVGDSVFVADRVRSALSSASQYGQRQRKVFTSRSVEHGVRIWRTA